MITSEVIAEHLGKKLKPEKFNHDITYSGITVENEGPVERLILGVSPTYHFFNKVHEMFPDLENSMIITHHGNWKTTQKEVPRITGSLYHLYRYLLSRNIALANYHLCLDYNISLGTNAWFKSVLGHILSIKSCEQALLNKESKNSRKCGLVITLEEPVPCTLIVNYLQEHVSKTLARKVRPQVVLTDEEYPEVKTIYLCVGGGQRFLEHSIAAYDANLFICGEYTEKTYYTAKEFGCNFVGFGHHNSEMPGVRMLGHSLAKKYNLPVHYIDFDNPF